MAVLDRKELEESPLSDLHAIASELGIEGYRLLRREQLIEAILGGGSAGDSGEGDSGEDDRPRRRRSRGGRGRRPQAAGGGGGGRDAEAEDEAPAEREPEPEAEPAPEEVRAGVLDILPNGSGFVRPQPFTHSPEDVYVSPAQIRRCELRPGDEVEGPVRPPRRNERHPSLVRVASVNGSDADAPSERPRFDSLTATWSTERLGGPNALVDAPYGKGSRVAIGGPPGAGATYLLREAVKVLRDRDPDLTVIVVLAGVRPEEAAEWSDLGVEVAGGSYDGSFDEQAQVADLAVQRAKRSVESGAGVGIVIDSLAALPPRPPRRLFRPGRNAADAGSLTIIASTGTSAEPHRM